MWRGRTDEGQAAVELALVLPLVVVLLLALVQVGLVVRDQVLVVHAAREAARQAAVAPGDDAVRRVAAAGSGLDAARLTVRVDRNGRTGGPVRVRIDYREPTDVPLVGSLVADLHLIGTTTMRQEF